MKYFLKPVFFILVFLQVIATKEVNGQPPCTTLGQTPATAFPVCGTTVFQQATVPICGNTSLIVPGCTNDGINYTNKNPYWYKFTCYQSGTLGFVITPTDITDDYDWQLYDITGVTNLNTVFTNASLVVTGNWSGSSGLTGASATGVDTIVCGSDPAANMPRFSRMPNIIAGHEYLLLVSHFTDTQSGYGLSFGGGNAVITDPSTPAMQEAEPDCDGTSVTLRLNKKVKCNSLSSNGDEFILSPALATVVSVATDSCAFGFDFDQVTLSLSNPLPAGNYQLIINNGTDGNTLLDNCDNAIPEDSRIDFEYLIPQPIFPDSVGTPGCAPDSVLVYFPKAIRCASITPAGSDFSITGPTPVTITGATGNCINDESEYIVLHLASPIYRNGNYTLLVQPGIDGSPILDVCGQPILPQALPFTTVDTVNADFTYINNMGCEHNTLTFSHNGAHNVNAWTWIVNNDTATTQSHTATFPASGTADVQLTVSNERCRDTSFLQLVFNNEVSASFTTEDIICPEDGLLVTNTSTGEVDIWRWEYDVTGSSSLQNPPPYHFPVIGREAYYTVKLVATNSQLGCSDSARKTVTVLDHCLIEVPTAFTPNNDGLNDTFGPHNALKADNYQFKVFNRWGQPVFQSNNWRQRWDGKINGKPQDTGVFVWMLSYVNRDTQQPVFRKGTVTLIRL